MIEGLLIYGATGYTGRLILREALSSGLHPILGGRTHATLRDLARSEGLEYRVASVGDPRAVAEMLRNVQVLLNAAGPFAATAAPLAQACIDCGAHYLDISGEFAVIDQLASLDANARRRGVMVMPGAGFDVVPSDCMAALVARRLPQARSLSIALSGLNAVSRGSAETVFVQYDQLVMVRRAGRLVRVAPGALVREFDFGQGSRRATAITWADVSSAYYTTGIPNITVYCESTPIVELGLAWNGYGGWLFGRPGWESWRRAAVRLLPEGPSSEERASGHAVVIAEAVDDLLGRVAVRLKTPEAYSFTAATSATTARRVLAGDFEAGFQTPGRVYGPEYALSLPGVTYSEIVVGDAPRESKGHPQPLEPAS